MALPFPLDRLARSFREGARRKRISMARDWPKCNAHITGWKIVDPDLGSGDSSLQQQIEASYYFMLNDDICGGYFRSVPMVRREAERFAEGDATVVVRYNPNDPDQVAVLAEDNKVMLPFEIISG
jgi:hypothetical protein